MKNISKEDYFVCTIVCYGTSMCNDFFELCIIMDMHVSWLDMVSMLLNKKISSACNVAFECVWYHIMGWNYYPQLLNGVDLTHYDNKKKGYFFICFITRAS